MEKVVLEDFCGPKFRNVVAIDGAIGHKGVTLPETIDAVKRAPGSCYN